ncbi:hypothetical protein IEN85_04730 [Pelagicoccus sp. NFK12]|uniref:Uncharacterized protein n=1 Tax=Pelagicoccus enzymogenes TaxID=2773457 RepID=A0A927IGV8_9BACT|nr:hypothetical protein [Pelagicoccus enzymogenes]MBD5778785.1 hypothetical protein [Pelagicoccus enzymogenes]
MDTKRISSPQSGSYPMEIKKALAAPGEFLRAGQAIYEIQDAQKRRLQVRCPLDGIVSGPVLAPGSILPSAQIILEIDPSAKEETVEAWTEPAAVPAPESPQPPRQSKRKQANAKEAVWLPLLGLFISPFLVWIALHLTHSLAPASYRYGAPALALFLPWLLYFALPGKSLKKSPAVDYGAGLLLGSLVSLIFFFATLFLPARLLAAGDSQTIHRLFEPITSAPLRIENERLYFLGQDMGQAQFDDSIPLSNGGALGWDFSLESGSGQTGQIWFPDGTLGPKLEDFIIQVFANTNGETSIATYATPVSQSSSNQPEWKWTRAIYSNEGRLLERKENLPNRPASDASSPIDRGYFRYPVPEGAVRIVGSYKAAEPITLDVFPYGWSEEN